MVTSYELVRNCLWRHQMETFPRYWPFVQGIRRSPVNSPHKGQWRGALMFSLTCAWINGWVSNHDAADLRRHRAHYDVTVMWSDVGFASPFDGLANNTCFRICTLYILYPMHHFIWSLLCLQMPHHHWLYLVITVPADAPAPLTLFGHHCACRLPSTLDFIWSSLCLQIP